jgi:hypothetical protein
VGLAVSHSPSNSGSFNAAPERSAKVPSIPSRSACAQILVGNQANSGCYGNFAAGTVTFGASSRAPSPAAYASANTAAASDQSKQDRNSAALSAPPQSSYQVEVPLDRAVTVELPAVSGKVWTAPAFAPDQGIATNAVRVLRDRAGVVGRESSATFESSKPVSVLVEASELDTCGKNATPCGSPQRSWSVEIVFSNN